MSPGVKLAIFRPTITGKTMRQRRHFSRVLFNARATLSGDAQSSPCEVLDLSLKGALVRVADSRAWSPESSCRLELALDPEQEVSIRMSAKVAHREGQVIGLHCVTIDLDSITHLRRLVELNLGDDSVLQREVSALTSQ
jgi:hypothetical protein